MIAVKMMRVTLLGPKLHGIEKWLYQAVSMLSLLMTWQYLDKTGSPKLNDQLKNVLQYADDNEMKINLNKKYVHCSAK